MQDESGAAWERHEWEQAEAILTGKVVAQKDWLRKPKEEVADCKECGKAMQWIQWAEMGLPFWTGLWPDGTPVTWAGGWVGWREVCAKCKRLGEFDAQVIAN